VTDRTGGRVNRSRRFTWQHTVCPHCGSTGIEGTRWTALAYDDDPDPELHSYTHLYADRRPWRPGTADGILREVADDVLSGVIITDIGLARIHHPYDGGADVIATSPQERDRLRDSHRDWLPRNPAGL
jgi:hypothetical protein